VTSCAAIAASHCRWNDTIFTPVSPDVR